MTIADNDNNLPPTIPKSITIASTNGGNTLATGSTHSKTWADNFSENVKIALYKGSNFSQTMVTSTPSDGTYNWTLPSILVGSDYEIDISSVSDVNILDTC